MNMSCELCPTVCDILDPDCRLPILLEAVETANSLSAVGLYLILFFFFLISPEKTQLLPVPQQRGELRCRKEGSILELYRILSEYPLTHYTVLRVLPLSSSLFLMPYFRTHTEDHICLPPKPHPNLRTQYKHQGQNNVLGSMYQKILSLQIHLPNFIPTKSEACSTACVCVWRMLGNVVSYSVYGVVGSNHMAGHKRAIGHLRTL